MKPTITSHTIIKNEDRWVWYAIMSVIDQVDRLLIYDTGSSDNTIKIIQQIDSPKISFKRFKINSRQQIVKLRAQQLKSTKTDWFLLLDGDEIWPKKNLTKLLNAANKSSKNTLALFNRTRNCVGDVFHYLPASKGHYQIKDQFGHLNMRLFRNVSGIRVSGSYPLEAYTYGSQKIQNISKRIKFVDTWYLHTTHLKRSSSQESEVNTIDRLKKRKFRFGKKMTKKELPQILWEKHPDNVLPPITNRWKSLFTS